MAVRHRDSYQDDWVTIAGVALIVVFLLWLGINLAH